MKLLHIIIIVLIFYFITLTTENFENEYILPKIIYCYWDNLENNSIINSHINTWKKKISSDWEIIILNKNNVNQYVSKDFIDKYKDLDPTRFADFLRVELLKQTGGVWMDSSIIITNGKFLDDYYNEMITNKYDVLLYELKENSLDKRIPYLENWFIMAPKDSKLINDLHREFAKSFDMGFVNYKKNILIPSGVLLDNTIGYEERTYLMQHAIINYLMFIGNKYYINIKESEESMFKIHYDLDWEHDKIADFISTNKKWDKYYGIKLTKATREYITNKEKYINNLNLI